MGITQYIQNTLNLKLQKEGEYSAFNTGSVECETGELLYAFTRIVKPKNILDLGTYKGVSAAYMGLAVRDNQNGGIVESIEFDSQHWNDAEDLWIKLGILGTVILKKMKVEDFKPEFRYDLILIDTEPDQRWKQLLDFYPYLNPGGYVFLHDLPRGFCIGNINPDHPEIKNWPWGEIPKEIENMLKDRELIPFHLPNPREMCGLYKARSDDYHI